MRRNLDSRHCRSRRQFLRLAAAPGVGWLVGGRASSLAQSTASDKKRELGLTGKLLIHATRSRLQAQDGLFLFDMKTETLRRILGEDGEVPTTYHPTLSPNGRTVAYVKMPRPMVFDGVWTLPTEGEQEPRRISEINGFVSWSPDSRQVIVSGPPRGFGYQTWLINADGTGRTRLPVPETHVVSRWSADGKWLLTGSAAGRDRGNVIEIMHPDGTEKRLLAETRVVADTASFAPDCRSVLYLQVGVLPFEANLWRVDLDGRNRQGLYIKGNGISVSNSFFSPDGKWVAATMINMKERQQERLLSRWIEILDKDGSFQHRIDLPFANYTLFDWR
ncbi:MAG TPA: hypothetical protein VGZ22_21295 [Isosphaeraceae bacterium]|nr:hypothetical protein [Isosphaeraceae bacterium]